MINAQISVESTSGDVGKGKPYKSDKFRGNLAIQDIQMALRWVQENIQSFGGDKQRVTLIGSGAGATIAHLLMLKVSSLV